MVMVGSLAHNKTREIGKSAHEQECHKNKTQTTVELPRGCRHRESCKKFLQYAQRGHHGLVLGKVVDAELDEVGHKLTAALEVARMLKVRDAMQQQIIACTTIILTKKNTIDEKRLIG